MALMFDMIALAFRADVTRVASVMMAAEASSMTYDHLGVPDSFHLLSHHQNDPDTIEKLVRIQTFHTRMFATFVRTLAELPDGDGFVWVAGEAVSVRPLRRYLRDELGLARGSVDVDGYWRRGVAGHDHHADDVA